MINYVYLTVNSKKTIFKKTRILDLSFMNCLLTMMHISSESCDELKNEFMEACSKDFMITGGGLMKTFLGMDVEQRGRRIKMYLAYDIQQVLAYDIQQVLKEYKVYIEKLLSQPLLPNVVLKSEDVLEVLVPCKQKHY